MPNVVPGVHHIANAYCYRCPFGLTYPSCDLKCAKDAEEAIQTMTSQGRVAAFLAEPIQGVGGFIVRRKNISRDRRHHPQIRRFVHCGRGADRLGPHRR